MTNRLLFGVAAATVSIAIASVAVVCAGWFAETVMSLPLPHFRHTSFIPFAVASFSGFPAIMVAIVIASRKKKTAPEEPMRPRIRNGRI